MLWSDHSPISTSNVSYFEHSASSKFPHEEEWDVTFSSSVVEQSSFHSFPAPKRCCGSVDSSAEDHNPAPEVTADKRDRIPCGQESQADAFDEETWVLYIPIYLPDFVLSWLRRIEIIMTADSESCSTGTVIVCPTRHRVQKSMNVHALGNCTHVCTQTVWDGEEEFLRATDRAEVAGLGETNDRVARMQRRLELVESGKALLQHRLKQMEERVRTVEEDKAAMAAFIANTNLHAPPWQLTLPPSFSRQNSSDLLGEAASSPVAYDMSFSSLLGL